MYVPVAVSLRLLILPSTMCTGTCTSVCFVGTRAGIPWKVGWGVMRLGIFFVLFYYIVCGVVHVLYKLC